MYWIALNRASCALCSIPTDTPPKSRPRPQCYVGFGSLAQAEEALRLCLNAPIEEVRERFAEWHEQGRVVPVRNPEQIAEGDVTVWELNSSHREG